MSVAAFERLHTRLLAHLGEEALFHGARHKIPVQHGVEVAQGEGDVAYTRSVATIPSSLAPRAGDTLAIGTFDLDGNFTATKSYTLDGPAYTDNGYVAKFVLLPD